MGKVAPPPIMYMMDIEDNFHTIDYYDFPLKGLTYVDDYLYMYEYDWDLHRYVLVQLGWFEGKVALLRRRLFMTLVYGMMHKPKWVRSIGWWLWYHAINRRHFPRA